MAENPIQRVFAEEHRVFHPTAEFTAKATISTMEEYRRLYEESIHSPETFWGRVAQDLHWYHTWTNVLDSSTAPLYKWFTGAKTNICYNAVDRNLRTKGNKAAIIFEGEPGEVRTYTYTQLHNEVCRFANTLLSQGVTRGDKVTIYMAFAPEAIFAMLACARIGAIHNVIFGGFASDAIRSRIQDCQSQVVIISDYAWRRGRVIPLKDNLDEALHECPFVRRVIVVRRDPHHEIPMKMDDSRDVWYHDVSRNQSTKHVAEEMDSEDMLFLLYTSGTTGTPKGIVHTTGGYMVGTYLSMKYIFDIKDTDVYWCTADIGWITGHSYVCYGPLINGATILLYEGAPNYPDEGRFWDIIERHQVSILYTAPTLIRACIKWGDHWPNSKDLSSLRLLGSVGEPINPEAWMWYHRVVGHERCPIVDTWWQTETGAIMITPLPGLTSTKPGSATLPFFGIEPMILEEEGSEHESNYGLLVIKQPWPSMLRGVYGNEERFRNGYFGKWEGKYYFTGDGCYKDADGYYWITGRVDDIVNVSGHRVSTAEVEGVLKQHEAVAESACIGIKDDLKGQGLACFVVLKTGESVGEKLRNSLKELVGHHIGRFVIPDRVIFVEELPKTRSGKIMRRLLKDIAEDRSFGNMATLQDSSILQDLKSKYDEK